MKRKIDFLIRYTFIGWISIVIGTWLISAMSLVNGIYVIMGGACLQLITLLFFVYHYRKTYRES